MSKKLQLSIPTPCHENWDAMTPVDKGKFCGSCQKQVVDFSNMNDRQMAEFFKKPSTGSVCGRFMTDQLERDIEIPKKRIPWLKYFFQFVIPAFLVSIKATSQKTQGKLMVTTVTTDTTKRPTIKLGLVRPICTKPLMGDTIITPVKYPVETIKGKISNVVIDQRNRTIHGKVTDEKGDALPGATIQIKGTRIGVSADNKGQFRILAKTGDILVVSGAGLVPTEAVVQSGNEILIAARRLTTGRTEVIVTAGMISVKKIKKQKKSSTPVLIQPIEPISNLSFKTFPNPVESGSSLNIEIKETEEGYYALQLLNQSGQSVHQQEIWIDAEARLLNIDIPAVAAGTYFLALTNKRSGKRFTEKIIIQ